MTEFEPGTLVVDESGNQLYVTHSYVGGSVVMVGPDGYMYEPTLVVNPHPLVVIDPENDDQTEEFWAESGGGSLAEFREWLREQVKPVPPKPEEPTKFGAMVIDGEGTRWVRQATRGIGPWSSETGMHAEWKYVDAVEEIER